jgi:hypothetical protein
MMEAYRKVWRDGFAPQLSDAELKALLVGIESDDPALVQGRTTVPIPLLAVDSWDLEGGDAIVYAAWKVGLVSLVGEGAELFGKRCAETDLLLGELTACRFWNNFWDDTSRGEAFAELAAEVRREIFRRKLRGIIKEDAIDRWLDTVNPNPTFGGRAPADLIRANEMGPLEQMLYQIESGVAS